MMRHHLKVGPTFCCLHRVQERGRVHYILSEYWGRGALALLAESHDNKQNEECLKVDENRVLGCAAR